MRAEWAFAQEKLEGGGKGCLFLFVFIIFILLPMDRTMMKMKMKMRRKRLLLLRGWCVLREVVILIVIDRLPGSCGEGDYEYD